MTAASIYKLTNIKQLDTSQQERLQRLEKLETCGQNKTGVRRSVLHVFATGHFLPPLASEHYLDCGTPVAS